MPQKPEHPTIAIDGPAGSGKSTVAREVSMRLNIKYLDTGAMYRAVTLKLIRKKADLTNLKVLEEILDQTTIQLSEDKQVILDGEDVTAEIRFPHVNEMVSPVSCISLIRRRLVAIQQAIARESRGIIMEGRDIASRVMPDADFKFYLDASVEERARRRSKEQREKGLNLPEDSVAAEILKRDSIDSQRDDSPLTIVADAIVIDTTGMTFDAVVTKIIETVNMDFH
ncbi:MAG: (d)CMP kinase [Clostridia bacterium]|nr:(d)CMP kinase [Clostridia bacterium]